MPSPAGLVVKNGLNIFVLHVRRNAGPIVADRYFDTVAKISCDCSERRLIVTAVSLCRYA